MAKLKEKLLDFNPASEEELSNDIFPELAKSFLYGGYISVSDNHYNERYRIYIRTVEFYCHYDGPDKNSKLPKDPIVYHRNKRYVEDDDVPYFPLMALHAHASGYDITFEKEEELFLRASALIRAYEVYDVKRGVFLSYDKQKKKWIPCEDVKKRVNTQSTYLYDFLNGFIGDSVKWVDDERRSAETLYGKPRKNVYIYEGETKTDKKDKRLWSFTRTEDLSSGDI